MKIRVHPKIHTNEEKLTSRFVDVIIEMNDHTTMSAGSITPASFHFVALICFADRSTRQIPATRIVSSRKMISFGRRKLSAPAAEKEIGMQITPATTMRHSQRFASEDFDESIQSAAGRVRT